MRRWGIAITLSLLLGCESPLGLPAQAVPYEPDRAQFIVWWRQVEACSGLRGDYDSVAFYIVPHSYVIPWGDVSAGGLYFIDGNRIVLAGSQATSAQNVRHEMLHALLKLPGHPAAYFRGVCDSLVD